MAFYNVERIDPGRPSIPSSIEHCVGRSGRGGASGSLRSIGSAVWVGVGGGRAQHSVICG